MRWTVPLLHLKGQECVAVLECPPEAYPEFWKGQAWCDWTAIVNLWRYSLWYVNGRAVVTRQLKRSCPWHHPETWIRIWIFSWRTSAPLLPTLPWYPSPALGNGAKYEWSCSQENQDKLHPINHRRYGYVPLLLLRSCIPCDTKLGFTHIIQPSLFPFIHSEFRSTQACLPGRSDPVDITPPSKSFPRPQYYQNPYVWSISFSGSQLYPETLSLCNHNGSSCLDDKDL